MLHLVQVELRIIDPQAEGVNAMRLADIRLTPGRRDVDDQVIAMING